MFLLLTLFCSLAFFGYGASCLLTGHMVREFERYGLPRFRVLTGVLQLLGATGLMIGVWVPLIGFLASGGLGVQMLLGFGVRLKIGDSGFQSAPAFSFLLINSWLCFQFWERLNS